MTDADRIAVDDCMADEISWKIVVIVIPCLVGIIYVLGLMLLKCLAERKRRRGEYYQS